MTKHAPNFIIFHWKDVYLIYDAHVHGIQIEISCNDCQDHEVKIIVYGSQAKNVVLPLITTFNGMEIPFLLIFDNYKLLP